MILPASFSTFARTRSKSSTINKVHDPPRAHPFGDPASVHRSLFSITGDDILPLRGFVFEGRIRFNLPARQLMVELPGPCDILGRDREKSDICQGTVWGIDCCYNFLRPERDTGGWPYSGTLDWQSGDPVVAENPGRGLTGNRNDTERWIGS